MEPEKHRRKLLYFTLHRFVPKFNQATDWPHLTFNVINILVRNSGSRNRAETRSRYGATDFCLFPLCPLCECLPLAGFPSTPVPNSTLQHCYTTFIMPIPILKQGSIGATSEMHLFPAKVGAEYAPGPTQPLRTPNFQQMSMV